MLILFWYGVLLDSDTPLKAGELPHSGENKHDPGSRISSRLFHCARELDFDFLISVKVFFLQTYAALLGHRAMFPLLTEVTRGHCVCQAPSDQGLT